MQRCPIRLLVAAGLLLGPLACVAETEDDEFDPTFLEENDDPAIDPSFTSKQPSIDTPQLRVLLTDAPADVDAVFVTFTQASVQACAGVIDMPEAPDDSGDANDGDDPDDDDAGEDPATDEETCESGTWMTISEEPTTFDLLSLQGGVTVELALAELPPGEYGQIRLQLDSASVVIDDQEYAVNVPPGILNLNGGFALEEGMQTELTVDFDAGESLHYAPGQGWMMVPVISVISETMTPLPEEPENEPDEPAGDPEPDPADPEDPDEP